MPRIRILPDDLINQIAAGEVIERPASVVKELLENALDAGARRVVVDVEGGGRRRIRVADDGEGLDRDEALLALERHATSKLRSQADLGSIATLGFRGEALPSIASVSRLVMRTSNDGRAGTRVEVEAGRIRQVAAAGHPRGTTMDVRDLFFNTPARAKFLKSAATELGHISDLVAAASIPRPDIALTLKHEGRLLIEAPTVAGVGERIRQVYGAEWSEAIEFDATRGRVAVRGLVLTPDTAGSAARLQQIYVNGRPVRDRLIGHAILSACEGFFPKGRRAPLFVFIHCPSESVDVNVHPAKAEVRFADGRLVHDLVQQAVLLALQKAMPVTAMTMTAMTVMPASGSGPEADPAALPPIDPASWTGCASHTSQRARSVGEPAVPYLPAREAAEGPSLEAPGLPSLPDGAVALAHYRESYIVAADGEGLLLIDQHAAHERILYEKIMAQTADDRLADRQRLLFPHTVQVPRRLTGRIEEVLAEMELLGFGVEPFGEGTVMIVETPSILEAARLPGLVEEILEPMGEEMAAPDGTLSRKQRLLATVACHAAIKVRMPLTVEKMNYLINELFRTQTPLKCPHGRPAVLRFSQAAIARGFDRR